MTENIDPKIILAAIAYVAWLIRLEAKVLYMEKDLVEYKNRIENERKELKVAEKEKDKVFWTKIESLQESIGKVLETVIRMEERTKHFKDEV